MMLLKCTLLCAGESRVNTGAEALLGVLGVFFSAGVVGLLWSQPANSMAMHNPVSRGLKRINLLSLNKMVSVQECSIFRSIKYMQKTAFGVYGSQPYALIILPDR